LERYGTDKPDLRFGMPFVDVTDALRGSAFRVEEDALESGARGRGIVVEGGAELSRRELEELTAVARAAGAGGARCAPPAAEGCGGPRARGLAPGRDEGLAAAAGIAVGDLSVAAAGHCRSAVAGSADRSKAMGGAEAALDPVRRHLGGKRGL